eukprot:gene42558-33504_t
MREVEDLHEADYRSCRELAAHPLDDDWLSELSRQGDRGPVGDAWVSLLPVLRYWRDLLPAHAVMEARGGGGGRDSDDEACDRDDGC